MRRRSEIFHGYLEAALEEGDPALVAAALGDIARAQRNDSGRPQRWPRPGKPLQGAIAGAVRHSAGPFGAMIMIVRLSLETRYD